MEHTNVNPQKKKGVKVRKNSFFLWKIGNLEKKKTLN